MKKFLRSIWPNTLPEHIVAGDEIRVLREQILQSFSLIGLGVGIAVLILILPTYIQVQRWGLIGIYFSCLFSMIAVAFIRRIPYHVRGSIALVIVYSIALGSLLVYGLSGNGPLLLVGFAVLSAIFLGVRPGIGAVFIALGTMAAVGYLMANRILPLPPVEIQANADNLSDWINRTLVVALLATIFSLSLTRIIKGLHQALLDQKKVSLEITQERQLLEERVRERTSELERRTFELETASKIAHEISQKNHLDELLPCAVELIQAEYQLYHAAVYLTDTRQEYAYLGYGSGEAGRIMLAINHRISLSEVNPVAQAINKNEVRLLQDVLNEPVFVQNPWLPETCAQLIIPLVAGGKVIGAVDAQGSKMRFFKPNDLHSLQIITDQLAVGIEKASIVQQLTTTLAEMREGIRRSTQEAWQGFHRASRRNYSFHIQGGKVFPGPLSYTDSSRIIASGKPEIQNFIDPQSRNPYTILTIPIKSRELILGTLDLRFDTEQLSPGIVDLVESFTNRLALAIENARLVEENKIKAARDHMMSDIGTKVRAEADIDKVMRIVASEIGRSLGVSDVIVQLRENDR